MHVDYQRSIINVAIMIIIVGFVFNVIMAVIDIIMLRKVTSIIFIIDLIVVYL